LTAAQMYLQPTPVPPLLSFDERPTVLIAEDEPKLRERLIAQLHALGISPRVTSKGYETLRVVEQHRPDLVLLDGLMPEMHGFEIARFIRRMDSHYRPRIAIVTAIYKNIRYQNEARLKYGIDDYLTKPVDTFELANVVVRARREKAS
jgi:two-component system, OmpR family, alkaline phosphatase synthesis response regulator PhoP